MTYSEKKIIESYSDLISSLSSDGKKELIEMLSKSIREDKKMLEKEFFSSFGAFASDKSPEDISNEIRESRNFRDKNLKF